jgi:hypothetical protein
MALTDFKIDSLITILFFSLFHFALIGRCHGVAYMIRMLFFTLIVKMDCLLYPLLSAEKLV